MRVTNKTHFIRCLIAIIFAFCVLTQCSCGKKTEQEIIPYEEDIIKDYSSAIYRFDAVLSDINAKVEAINAVNTLKAKSCNFSFAIVIPTLPFTEFEDFDKIVAVLQETYKGAEVIRNSSGDYFLKTEVYEKSEVTGRYTYLNHQWICLYDENHDWLKTIEDVDDGTHGVFEYLRYEAEGKEIHIGQNKTERLYAEYTYDYTEVGEEKICTGKRLTYFNYSATKEPYTDEDTIFTHIEDIHGEWVTAKNSDENIEYNGETLVSVEKNKINGERERKVLYE